MYVGSHLVGIRFRCDDVVLEIVLVHEVATGFGKREVVRVGVFWLKVEVKVSVDADVQGIHISEGSETVISS